jgi:hypothetical protein
MNFPQNAKYPEMLNPYQILKLQPNFCNLQLAKNAFKIKMEGNENPSIRLAYDMLVNPDNYIEFVRKSYFEKNCIPLLVTAFGDIVVWEKNEYLSLLTYRNFDCLEYGCEFLFNDLSDNEYVERHFKNRNFYKALEKLDIPSYDECFGYVPLLSLGGSEKPENLQNVKLREHLELMYQMQGCI